MPDKIKPPTLGSKASLGSYDTLGKHGVLGNPYAPYGGYEDSALAGASLLSGETAPVTVIPRLAPTITAASAEIVPPEFGSPDAGDGAAGAGPGDPGDAGSPGSADGGGPGGEGDGGAAGEW